MACLISVRQLNAPTPIQEGPLVQHIAEKAETNWVIESDPFNLDPFIFGHSSTMQGGGQRDVESRGRGRKKTKWVYRKLPELGKRHTREQGGGKSEYEAMRRAVVMESMNFSTAAAGEDQPHLEQ